MALFENMALRAKRVLVYGGMEAKACAVQYEWTSVVIRISKAVLSANGDIVLKNKVTVEGQLGIGVKNPQHDVDLTVAGAVRIQNKKFTVGSHPPTTGPHLSGDVVWNSDPQPTGYVGWVCVRPGSPGDWKAFGLIQS